MYVTVCKWRAVGVWRVYVCVCMCVCGTYVGVYVQLCVCGKVHGCVGYVYVLNE